MDFLWHFAGVWPLISKMTGTGILIAALLAFAFLTPEGFLPIFSRKIAIWAAAVLAYGFVAYTVGVFDEAHRRDAKQAAGLKVEAAGGEKIRKSAERVVHARRPSWMLHDPRNRDSSASVK